MAPISTLRIEPKSTDGSGGIATVVADVTWQQAGNTVRVRSLLVWRRETDGRWRVAREMLNTGAPDG